MGSCITTTISVPSDRRQRSVVGPSIVVLSLMNRRHKVILAASLAGAGLALLNDGTIRDALGIVLLGTGIAWLIGSQFVLSAFTFAVASIRKGLRFIWRHRTLSGTAIVVAVGTLYGWNRVQYRRPIRLQAVHDCEMSNNFEVGTNAKCSADPATILHADSGAGDPVAPSVNPANVISAESQAKSSSIPDQWSVASSKAPPVRRRGKAIFERSKCDDVIVYDRERFGDGNPLIVDRLAKGDMVQLLGHVTIGDEEIVKTPRGQRGFIFDTSCVEIIPADHDPKEEQKNAVNSEEHTSGR